MEASGGQKKEGPQQQAMLQQLLADAADGDALAQFRLAQAYESGKGVSGNESESIRWYKAAAEQGHLGALYSLGVAHQRGHGITVPQDSKTATEYFKRGAELGDMHCQCALADAYRDGRGVPKEELQAVHWYTKASEQGNANAQYRLGKLYRHGTTRDIALAIHFFGAAAKQGHADAAVALDKATQYAKSNPVAKARKYTSEAATSMASGQQRSMPFVIIDSSVLLKDPDVIRRVIANKGVPCISNTILSELDHNKTNRDPAVADSARRLLRELAKESPLVLHEFPEGGTPIGDDRVQRFTYMGNGLLVFARERHRGNRDNDAKIISVAKDYGMIIITADSGLKVRAEALGVQGFVWTGTKQNGAPAAPKANTSGRPLIAPFDLCKSPIAEKPVVLTLAAMPKEGDAVASGEHGRVRLIRTLSAGGEGTIFETDCGDYVCKIYHRDRLTSISQKKITLMLSRNIVKEGICWPVDFVTNNAGQFVGYLMPRAKGKPMQHTMFVKPLLERSFPNWSRIDLVNLCLAFLDRIAFLHSINILVGDINPLNALVTEESNSVWLVDTDSFQIEGFACPVGTVNFTAPEIQGINYTDFLRTREHELFAIATMLFMILHPGKPPYAQQGGGDPAENIKKQDFSYPYGKDVSGKAPEGPWQNIWANLPGRVKEAFWNTFKNNQRIEVTDWKKLLKLYRSEILKGWHSNEIFPTTFKIVDPVEVVCGNCSEKVVASEKRYQRMIGEGKPYYCGKCMANIRLQILARKARDANQLVRASRSRGSNLPVYFQPSNPPRTPTSQRNAPTSKGFIGGIFDALFSLFK